MTVVETYEIPELPARGEHGSRGNGYTGIEGQSMNVERIDRGRTLDPEKISACGRSDAVAWREVTVHGFQCNGLLICQDAAKPHEVRFVAAELQHLRDT